MRKNDLFKQASGRKAVSRAAAVVLAAGLAATVLTACGGGGDSSDSVSADGVRTIVVGSGTSYNPYCYIDDNGDTVGYEYDVLKAVDERLEDYEFKYESMDFDNLLLSLDAGKVDLVAHQYEATDERKEKYLFANEAYTTYESYLTVLADNTTINSLEDVQGKKVWAGGTTSAINTILVNYNNEHPDNPIQLVNNNDTSGEYQITNLREGAWAATTAQTRDVDSWNAEYGNVVKIVGDPLNKSLTYYLYRQGEEELRDAVDNALKELKEDGTLARISEQWLGGDYTKGFDE